MNYITVAIVALMVLPILVSVLLGLLRGSRRSLLRLALVIVSVVLAFALCGVVAKPMLGADISNSVGAEGPMTVEQYLVQMLGEAIPDAVTAVLLAIVQSIVKVIVFLLLFLVFRFLTWAIVFPILKIFVKPKKVRYTDGSTGRKKRPFLGLLVGLVQGAVVALCICVVLNGLFMQTNKIVTMASDLGSISEQQTMTLADAEEDGDEEFDPDDGYNKDDEQPSENPLEDLGEFGAMLSEYTESKLGAFYNKIGGKAFDWLSEVENANGDKVTMSGQLDAIRGVVEMAKELMNLKDINFQNLFAEGNIDAIRDIFNSLQNINGNLSKESRDTIKGVLSSLSEELDLPVDLSDVDFNKIDFGKEGEIFVELLEYRNNDEIKPEDVKDMLESMVESDLILDVLASQDGLVDLGSQIRGEENSNGHNDEYVQTIEDTIAAMEGNSDYDQEKVAKLKSIFGL